MWGFEGLLAGVVGPGHGEVAGEGPDLFGLVAQVGGEVVSGVVAACPVAVAVGGDGPTDRLVVAAAQLGEQLGVELVVTGSLGGGGCGGGLTQHGDDVAGPISAGWV
ncbi:MAG: hypothetical protein ABR608_15645 [Pseudonocardiaceae bacterium]